MFLVMGRRVRLAVQTLKGEQVNAREKLKVDSKRTRRAFPEWWSEEDFAWWSKGKKGFSKAFQKAMNAFRKVGFRTCQPEEGAGKDFLQHEGRGGKGGAYPQSGLSAPETPSEEGFCRAWESDDWSSSHWPDESSTSAAGWSCTRAPTIQHTWFSILAAHGRLDQERQSKDFRSRHGIVESRRSFAVAISLSCSPTQRQELVGKVVLFTFQQHLRVLPELMCLRQVMFPACSPSLR